MDSRRLSAALGFTLLIGCVIGIVILIHNSGSTRRSSQQNRIDDHIISWNGKEGFVNDPNYHSSQPTMQEVNELADELHRLLSSKTKLVEGEKSGFPRNITRAPMMVKNNGTMNHKHNFQSATSPVTKASISAINYSIVSPNNQQQQQKTGGGGGVGSSLTSNYSSSPPTTSSLVVLNRNGKEQQPRPGPEMQGKPRGGPFHQQQQHFHHHHQQQHPGHQKSPGRILDTERLPIPSSIGKERGGAHNDLYTTSWLPSMVSPGILPSPSHKQQHHHHQLQQHRHPYQQHREQFPYRKINEDGGSFPPSSSTLPGRAGIPKTPPGRGIGQYGNGQQVEFSAGRPHHRPAHWEDDFVSGEDDHELEGNDVVDADEDNLGDDEEEEEEEEEDEDAEPKNFTAELETLLDLANHLYTSGANGSAFQGFLKVINETIQRGNNSRLLVELNEMYGKANISRAGSPGSSAVASLQSELLKARNPYETSLTAFVFMSFGVFLLNQIHSFVQKASPPGNDHHNNSIARGRALEDFEWLELPTGGPVILTKEASSLDILFQPPPSSQGGGSGFNESSNGHNGGSLSVQSGRGMGKETHYENISLPGDSAATSINSSWIGTSVGNGSEMGSESSTGSEESSSSERMIIPLVQVESLDSPVTPKSSRKPSSTVVEEAEDWRSSSRSQEDNSFSSTHVNNMFRGLLNIVNAYTKDSQALECIWSLYCQDLDKTAGKQGLYGVAARINSVGLRLIMNQIPASLTMDVILRSLVGWDGLPCRKMFPECAVGNGTILRIKDETALVSNTV